MTLDSLSGSAFGADELIAVHMIWTQLEGMFVSMFRRFRFKMSDLSAKDNNIMSSLKVCQRLKYLAMKQRTLHEQALALSASSDDKLPSVESAVSAPR